VGWLVFFFTQIGQGNNSDFIREQVKKTNLRLQAIKIKKQRDGSTRLFV
jgi:hypothetical protein